MYFKQFLALLLLLSVSVVSSAVSSIEGQIRIANTQNEWQISPIMSWFSSNDSRLDAAQALNILKTTPASHLPGFSRESIWLLIPIEFSLPFDTQQPFWITKSNAFLHRYNLYLFDANDRLVQADSLGISSKETYQRPAIERHASRLFFEGMQQYFLVIEMQSDTPLGNQITLRSESYYQEYLTQEWLTLAIMITILIAMFVFNSVIYFGNPDRAYFWFLIFHIGLFVYITSTYGLGHHFFTQDVIEFAGTHVMVINFTLLLLLYKFSYHFLNAFKSSKGQKSYFDHNVLVFLIVLGLLASFGLSDHIMLPAFLIMQMLVMVIISVRSILFYVQGFRPALFLFLSILIQNIGAVINIAAFLYVIPLSTMNQKAFFISSIVELLVFAYAMSVKARYLEKEKIWQSQIDQLTGVVNATYIDTTLTKSWCPLIKNQQVAVICIRLTGFEEFSRSIGPAETDNLVKHLIHRLDGGLVNIPGVIQFPGTKNSLCAQTKTRYLALVTSAEPIDQKITRLKESMDLIIDRQSLSGSIDVRLGYYYCQDSTEAFDEVLRKAMVALTLADSKTEHISRYDLVLDEQFKVARLVKRELHSAIKKGELKLYVQPQVNIQTNQIIGAEVLIRWIHPERGFISPSVFIPLTEQLNLVTEVSRLVLSETYKYLSENPILNMSFSVNLSAKDLMVVGFVDEVKSLSSQFNIGKNKVCLEITESSLIERPDITLNAINDLKKAGLPIAVDDFGTGYSSLTYLSQIRPNEVKLDQSFIRALLNSKIDQDIVESIIKLSHNMDAVCIAEGIENKETLEKLVSLGCQYGQGFFWSLPMPIEDFIFWVHEYKKTTSPP